MIKTNKKLLIIAPHPDDEINLAGQLLFSVRKDLIDAFVLYTTNGDSERRFGNKRLNEALKANEVLGISNSHVIFLGYPNDWIHNDHIYNASNDKQMLSKTGKSETNSIPEHPEYCFEKEKKHHEFTRRNFKSDFRKVLLDLMPEFIIYPDFDSHPDHRATSLIFEEIMGEILKLHDEYQPIILKKNIHEGVWMGPKDYYVTPPIETITSGKKTYAGGLHDMDAPDIRWGERVSFQADKGTITNLLCKNPVFKAAKKHKLTTSWYEMQRVINADIVYWLRRTDNLIFKSHISASSGNVNFLNDFKRYDSKDITNREEPFADSYHFCWIPDLNDEKKTIDIQFLKPQSVRYIHLYEDCNSKNHIRKVRILVDDSIVFEGELCNDGTKKEIMLENEVMTTHIRIIVIDYLGTPGIAEVEAYTILPDIGDLKQIPLFCCSNDVALRNEQPVQKLERFLFLFFFLFSFKIKYEIKRGFKSLRRIIK